MKEIALILVIAGALNWLMVGLFQYDVISATFGGTHAIGSRTIDVIIGLGGLYCLTWLGGRPAERSPSRRPNQGNGPS